MLLPNALSAFSILQLGTLCLTASIPILVKPPITFNLSHSPTNPTNHTPTPAFNLTFPSIFHIPASSMTLRFTATGGSIPLIDTNMCIIEALAELFALLLRNRLDGLVPIGWHWAYGDVYFGVIEQDTRSSGPSDMRMSDAVVVLRGLAMVTCEFGYMALAAQVVHDDGGVLGNVALWI